jgi:hypothetical protein
MATSRHCIRVYINPGFVELRAECDSSTDADCKIEGGDGNGGIVCRYVQWWKETEIALDEFYAGKDEKVLLDGAEITIDWDGEAWVWDLLNG